MQPFTALTSHVAPLDRADVDTDALIPKQFMKSIARTGFGDNLFDAWRYRDPGYPGKPQSAREPEPDFVLNRPSCRGAQILLARVPDPQMFGVAELNAGERVRLYRMTSAR